MLDAAPNAIVAVDADGLIRYVNAQTARTFGYAAAELLGEPVEVLIPERLVPGHSQRREAFSANSHARPMGIGLDLWARRKDGTEFPVEISLSPLDTDDGRVVFATVVDITARKAAESQVLQAQKLESIGRLAGGVAHDFSNMLFAIRGFTDMLIEDMEGSRQGVPFDIEAGLRSLRSIEDAAERASVLTQQLLAFGRRQLVQPKVLDLNGSVRSVEPLLQRLIGETVELRLSLATRAGRIRADPGQIDQILLNLVVNARDAMPDGGTITIETGNAVFDEAYAMEHFAVEPGEFVLLAVSDTGVGMDYETRKHIFEPFFTTKELGRGTGLGLATTYGIVQQTGGHIWLYSEPGRGTTFKLYFPRVDGELMGVNPTAIPSETRGTVLLVEDEDAVRSMTRQALRRAGWTVIEASSGGDAIQLIESMVHPIDALITDVVMPGISGIRLAETVLDRLPHVRVVLMSGYTADTLDLEAVLARGARFVSKPVARRDLLAALETESVRNET